MSKIIKVSCDPGCIAIVNPNTFEFQKEDQILYYENLLEDANNSKIFLWGVTRGNWNIEIDLTSDIPEGFRSLQGSIASDGTLFFVSNDVLGYGVLVSHELLLQEIAEEWKIEIPSGRYICTVVQLFDPATARESSVWDSDMIHYHLSLNKSDDQIPEITDFPWENYKDII